MSIAIVFPGQGSQKVGMGREVSDAFEGADLIWAQANEILGADLQTLCFEGPDEQLKNTLYAQPALLTVGVLHFLHAQAQGLQGTMTAGHSLGEYTALVAAGALSFPDALRLVKRRAELMAQAPEGAMAALIGLADEKLDEVLEAARPQGALVAANFNSPGQVVVSGAPAAIEAAMSEAKARGAKIAVRLPVSGAFHSPLMEAAGQEMEALIDAAPFEDATIPVFQNTSAQPSTAANALKAALKPQMTGAVLWTQTVQNMVGAGATEFVELGPGNVLTGLIKRIDKTVATRAGV
jgi:[acyl-carrier-protein] S-malonyltransferase